MVRREEQPWESRATVVLDTRRQGHRGEGPTASFEWAVSAAASIALHLRRSGYRLRLVTGGTGRHPGTRSTSTRPSATARAPCSTHWPTCSSSRGGDIAAAWSSGSAAAPTAAWSSRVLGGLTLAEAEALGALRANGTTCIALAHRQRDLAQPGRAARGPSRPPTHEAAALALLRSGWRVVGVEHGASLAALWPQAARGSQGFALAGRDGRDGGTDGSAVT